MLNLSGRKCTTRSKFGYNLETFHIDPECQTMPTIRDRGSFDPLSVRIGLKK